MLIDTHAHLYDEQFAHDLEDILLRAREVEIDKIFLPAVDVASVHQALDLSSRYDGIYAMAAIHPTYVPQTKDTDFEEIKSLCNSPGVVAVGESGLDYYWDEYYDERQLEFFARHIQLSMETQLPLVIHLRDKKHLDSAHRDAIQLLQKKLPPFEGTKPRGIFHCFTGPEWLPSQAADLGFLLGVGGAVTFKNSGVAEMLREIPLSQIVLETDAPYMAPTPHRGKRNEPAWMQHIAQKVAEIKKTTVAEVAEITSANARQLFQIDA